MVFFRLIIFLALSFWFQADIAYALQKAKPIATDNRIRTFVYNPNEVYVVLGHFRYQTSIEFEKDEAIRTVSLGDSTGWQISPQGARIFLKPIEKDATTNMTVITDKRTYFFELYAAEASDIRDENLVFTIRFIYGNNGSGNETLKIFTPEITPEKANESFKPDLSKPENYNFNYTLSGSEVISPVKVFDDGEFTFFQFRDKNGVIPAFFEVNSEGKEALINYRMLDDYVVVERVTSQFTLRNGDEVVCVFNELKPLTKPDSSSWGPDGVIVPKKRK